MRERTDEIYSAFRLGFEIGRSSSKVNGSSPSQPNTPQFEFYALGELKVVRDNLELDLNDQRGSLSLLGLMLSQSGSPLSIDRVVESLWPDTDPRSASNRLSIALHYLRRQLGIRPGEAPLARSRRELRVEIGENCQLDAADFAYLATSENEELRKTALSLYAGDLLEGLGIDELITPEREELRRTALVTLYEIGVDDLSPAELQSANKILRLAIAANPYDEQAYGKVIELELRRGNRAVAEYYYRECCKQLAVVDATPASRTTALLQPVDLADSSRPLRGPLPGTYSLGTK